MSKRYIILEHNGACYGYTHRMAQRPGARVVSEQEAADHMAALGVKGGLAAKASKHAKNIAEHASRKSPSFTRGQPVDRTPPPLTPADIQAMSKSKLAALIDEHELDLNKRDKVQTLRNQIETALFPNGAEEAPEDDGFIGEPAPKPAKPVETGPKTMMVGDDGDETLAALDGLLGEEDGS